MTDRDDLRRRAAQQSGHGNYWAGKCVGLLDALRAVTAERDALRAVVRRFGPPPGTLLLPQDEADAFRRALEETP